MSERQQLVGPTESIQSVQANVINLKSINHCSDTPCYSYLKINNESLEKSSDFETENCLLFVL